MTRVRIDKSGLGRDIYITGHCANENSGSAEATLVCAAMTTLAQTIAQNVFDSEDTGDTDIIDVTLRSGQAVISYVTDDDGLNTAVDGICKGFDIPVIALKVYDHIAHRLVKAQSPDGCHITL